MPLDLMRRTVAEAVGTALLLAAVVGSGIMGDRLAGGNVAIALLANTVSTGAVLVALILALGPNLRRPLQSSGHTRRCLADKVSRGGGAGIWLPRKCIGAFAGVAALMSCSASRCSRCLSTRGAAAHRYSANSSRRSGCLR